MIIPPDEDKNSVGNKAHLLQTEMIVQRNGSADRNRDGCIHNSVIHASSDIVPLQNGDTAFDGLHASRLSISDQHVNFGFQLSQLFQYFALKGVIVQAQKHRGFPVFAE